ncbi:hypothetical protein J6590_054973 [Homalodisca vitripennis]|nr:hypothetical protein J6590_054973 [Homalodisca vitripennis]
MNTRLNVLGKQSEKLKSGILTDSIGDHLCDLRGSAPVCLEIFLTSISQAPQLPTATCIQGMSQDGVVSKTRKYNKET